MKTIYTLAVLICFAATAQTNQEACVLIDKIDNLIRREHFRPKPIDDSLSAYVFETFIDRLDENHVLFTKEEYESLSRHRLAIDDYILKKDCSFLSDFGAVYRRALQRKRDVLLKLNGTEMNYSGKDSMRFSKDAFPFDLKESQIENVWRKRLAFDILEDISKQSGNLDSLKANFDTMEKAAYTRVFENTLCRANSELERHVGINREFLDDFFNAFCTYFDPHTNYFYVDDKMSFMSSLSTSNLSLGLEFAVNEKSEITIVDIAPGGPAAQSRKFDKDDLLVKVADASGRQYLVSCTAIETIGDIIFSDANKHLVLTVKKKNGAMHDISLKKRVMKAAENSVYSFVAEEAGSRIGYLKIPSFYSDFDMFSNHGCAEDAAVEIEKLLKENIDGFVVDLMDNGGGSMDEAVKLAGLFIDSGPIAVAVNRYRHQEVLRDYFPGTMYSGPMVVLINGASASASEFFAAAMQDYNRAIIAGTTSLGKATIQVMLPVDSRQQEFVKTTVEKFYRINGQSAQIHGVKPDIVLPFIYSDVMPGERSEKMALKSDVNPEVAFKKLNYNFSGAIASSVYRVAIDKRFNDIELINKQVSQLYNNPVPKLAIKLEDVFGLVKHVDGIWNKIKAENERVTGLRINNPGNKSKNDKARHFEKAEYSDKDQINRHKIKEAECNAYLQEAVRIIADIKKNPEKTYYKLGKIQD